MHLLTHRGLVQKLILSIIEYSINYNINPKIYGTTVKACKDAANCTFGAQKMTSINLTR